MNILWNNKNMVKLTVTVYSKNSNNKIQGSKFHSSAHGFLILHLIY